MKNYLNSLKIGDKVTRMLAGKIPCEIKITEIDDFIHCGPWKFHKETGGEVDEVLGWDGVTKSGSVLRKPEPPMNILMTDEDLGHLKAMDAMLGGEISHLFENPPKENMLDSFEKSLEEDDFVDLPKN